MSIQMSEPRLELDGRASTREASTEQHGARRSAEARDTTRLEEG